MMKIFSKEKDNTVEPEIGSKEIDRFCQRPYGHCRPIDYIPNDDLFNKLKDELDSWLESLTKGELDEGNADVLDSLIIDYVRLAIEDISLQYIKHIDTINGLYNRFATDPECFETEIEDTERILDDLERDYEELRSRSRKLKWRK